MESVIAAVIVIAIVALAVWYIYKAKKSGKKCIGCPDGGSCSGGSCGCGCGCSGESSAVDETK